MKIQDILIPRDKLPAGCRFQGSVFIESDADLSHREALDNETRWQLHQSVAYYDLMDALSELVDSDADLKRAKQRHEAAMARVNYCWNRSEYIQDLPGSPWGIKGHVVHYVEVEDTSPSYVVEPLSDMESKP